MLLLNPKSPESMAYAIDLRCDFGVGQSSIPTDDSGLFTPPFSNVAIHKMVYQVVLLW